MIIYTKDEATHIVDLFENVLERHDIHVPSPEDDQRGPDNTACLYGSVYGELLDMVEDALIDILKRGRCQAEICEHCYY